jgi:hypothetical protein
MNPFEDKNSEITDLTAKLHHLIENCTHNMGQEEWEVIQEKMKLLIAQSSFWLANENASRFTYDLREFCLWLCDYISEKETEFWGEE